MHFVLVRVSTHEHVNTCVGRQFTVTDLRHGKDLLVH